MAACGLGSFSGPKEVRVRGQGDDPGLAAIASLAVRFLAFSVSRLQFVYNIMINEIANWLLILTLAIMLFVVLQDTRQY